MEKDNHPISDKVLARIKARQISMRPRIYFTLQVASVALLALFTLACSVAIGSFILFSVRASSEQYLLGFGARGLWAFFLFFPWPLLILDGLLLLLLEQLLRRFRWGYRSPLLYVLFAVIVVALSAAFAFDRIRLNDTLFSGARSRHIPVFGELYDRGRRPPPPGSGACRCVIAAINADGTITAHDDDTHNNLPSTVTIMLPPGFATSTLQVGERVFVAGDYASGTLKAFGLHPIGSDDVPPPFPDQQ